MLDAWVGERYNKIQFVFRKRILGGERMRKIAAAVFVTGLFVLMLSALVVTPAQDAAPAQARSIDEQHAVFLMPVDANGAMPSALPQSRYETDDEPVAVTAVSHTDWQAQGLRDSNGHVLLALRYEDCVYQVFRAEIAGG